MENQKPLAKMRISKWGVGDPTPPRNARPADVSQIVSGIIRRVKKKGDRALFEYSEKFDKKKPESLRVSKKEVEKAYSNVSKKELSAIKKSASNIRAYSKKILSCLSTKKYSNNGVEIEPRVIPLNRVGCYVPGGRFPLPSSALMTIIPAKAAGVKEVAVCTPPDPAPSVLVACDQAGADEIFSVGGAQAIAAMAYGTKTIRRVDKIVGPGNLWVATAKKLVYGDVDIDFLAGPSELAVLADDSAEPELLAWDLLAQAEHDPSAYCVLITTSKKIAEEVSGIIEKKLEGFSNKNCAKPVLENSEILLVKNMETGLEAVNEIAPEHLEVFCKDKSVLDAVRNAGVVFFGRNSPTATSDYASGSNHVLPTGGLARARGSLGPLDFLKIISFQTVSKQGLSEIAETVVTLARLEGLEAHAKSVSARFG